MKFRNITNTKVFILISSIIITLIFGYLYLNKENYEFVGYVSVLIFFIVLITILNNRFNFSNGVLLGMGIWGILHMSGGYFIIGNGVLYGYQIFPFLRFDQFVHAWGFGFATLMSYYILKKYIDNEKVSWIAFSIFLVLIGMGWGALNEIIEFIAVLTLPQTGVGGYENTMWDIVFNTIGAVIAIVYIYFKENYIKGGKNAIV